MQTPTFCATLKGFPIRVIGQKFTIVFFVNCDSISVFNCDAPKSLIINLKKKMSTSFAEELAGTRDERAKALNLQWAGPITFEPLEFFSVFKFLFRNGCDSYSTVFWPWVGIMILCVIWSLIIKIGLEDFMPHVLDMIIQEGLAFAGLLGGAISFLLAFRLARAAARFWDCR
jgi:hypothetical protein